jgi:hypothetical protein
VPCYASHFIYHITCLTAANNTITTLSAVQYNILVNNLVGVSVRKRFATLATLQRPITRVQLHDVILEVGLASTSRRTQFTLEDWLATSVNQLVSLCAMPMHRRHY